MVIGSNLRGPKFDVAVRSRSSLMPARVHMIQIYGRLSLFIVVPSSPELMYNIRPSGPPPYLLERPLSNQFLPVYEQRTSNPTSRGPVQGRRHSEVFFRNVNRVDIDAVFEPPLLVGDRHVVATHLTFAHETVLG